MQQNSHLLTNERMNGDKVAKWWQEWRILNEELPAVVPKIAAAEGAIMQTGGCRPLASPGVWDSSSRDPCNLEAVISSRRSSGCLYHKLFNFRSSLASLFLSASGLEASITFFATQARTYCTSIYLHCFLE